MMKWVCFDLGVLGLLYVRKTEDTKNIVDMRNFAASVIFAQPMSKYLN